MRYQEAYVEVVGIVSAWKVVDEFICFLTGKLYLFVYPV